LEVLAPGLCTTVQDLGRIGYQQLGVPVSGALDAVSLRLANAVLGNPPGMPGLEILFSGPRLKVAAERVRLAVGGPGARLAVIGEPARTVPAWQSVSLAQGAVFRVVPGDRSACCYLAVEGGIAVPPVLGSAATYLRAGLGGLDGRALRQGDLVPLALAAAPVRAELRLGTPPDPGCDRPIRVVLGPQQDRFADEAIATLLGAEFRVSPNADRMGMRLDGPLLRHRAGWDIVSDAIATGAIQVPGSGRPVVLLADHQTTGGYPKIATVISADLPVLGRRRPGDGVRFVAVSVEEGEALCRAEEQRLARLAEAAEPVAEEAGIDLASLYHANLISGVVTGKE
ncbi:MAG TPA: biotin-dependent carboxyltransferase family protein, partial [Stellaceae bacterium]|nr:biotin-dependent carboxyltransferase family protein [Stellaceae bacterium]